MSKIWTEIYLVLQVNLRLVILTFLLTSSEHVLYSIYMTDITSSLQNHRVQS